MFVRKGKFDSKVLLDTGPASSRGKMSLSETYVNGMDRRAMENCVNKTVLVEEVNTEPDSSVNYADDGATRRPIRKRVDDSPAPISVEFLNFDSIDGNDADAFRKSIFAVASERKPSKRAETDSLAEDGKDSRQSYSTAVRSGNGVISEPIETSIVQNVSKLTKNFTLSVSGVGSPPGVQNVVQSVSGGNQTLWLPTIIASGAANDNEDRAYEDETEAPTTTVSQIILTGAGQHFTSHSVANPLSASKPCQISNHKFSPKVQILGGVTVPKQNSLPVNNQNMASSNVKTIHANYVNQSEITHVNSSISSGSSKHIISNSFLNQISNKMPFAANRAQCGPVQVKCSPLMNSIQMKSIPTAVNRSINKINNNNNNNNNNSKIENAVHIPDQSGHVFSRVISTPKISLQSSGRVVKSANIQYNQKPVMTEMQQNSNIIHTHKVQSAMPMKIIQQQTISSGHKAGFKTVPTSRATIGATKNVTYNSVSSVPGKGWLQSSSTNVNHAANPKSNSSFHKNITSVVNMQKVNSKTPTQKVIVHQPTSQIIMSNSAPLNRINSQHYQAGDVGNAQSLRYVQNYVGTENNNSPSVSCSQTITAQILQSFSQSKIVLPSVQHLSPTLTSNKRSAVPNRQIHLEDVYVKKSYDQKRQIHGDPNTVLTTDDILGTYEERPRISDDSLPYHFHSLQLVMLDHTYAQTISNNSMNGTNAVPNQPSPVNNNIPVSSPVSPAKAVPHITSTPSNGTMNRQSPITTTSPMLPNNTSSIAQSVTSYQYNPMPVEDDDNASVISSIEGDRDRDMDRAGERHDSDTETAPEGEEEGKTRCVCEFTHDDGYMICCDKCGEWQHVDCMGIDRQNIPDDYMCDRCEPRLIDRKRARSIQIRKREELTGLGSSGSDSSSGASINNHRNKQVPLGAASSHKKRPLTVTTYSNTISGVSRTVPTPSTFSPPYTISTPLPVVPIVKKVPKRSRRIDNSRKIPKRKLPEKRKRKSSEVSNYRSKYCPVTTSSQISQWSESYELAKTNHYSPELRAKIARYSNRGGNNNPNLANVLTTHLCTTVPHAGSKILIATKDLKESSPIVELRGKYMLSNQHKPQPQLSSRVSSQRPGPFLFFYHLPKDSTQICIDTRTYGNEARFVRRSCKPNAELQHCIIKGTLHVYLVTINAIQSNTEISIRHDANGVFQPCACGNPKHCKQPGVNSPSVVHKNNGANSDICHERRGRTRYSSSSNNFSNAYTKYDIFMKSESPELEKIEDMETDSVDVMKREVIESIIFDKSEDVATPVMTNDESPVVEKKPIDIKPEPVITTEKIPIPLLPDKKVIECVKEEVEVKSAIKEEKPDLEPTISPPVVESESEKIVKLEESISSPVEADCKSPTPSSSKISASTFFKTKDADKCPKKTPNSRRTSVHSTRSTRASSNTFNASESADEKSDTQCDSKPQGPKDKKKLTREERKIEAIMKAFERMEKAEQRRNENKDRQSKRRESDSQPLNSSEKDCKDQNDDQNDDSEPNSKRRRRKKGRSRTVSQSQSQRNRNRFNSIDSDMVTSGEESTSLLSPPVSSSNMINDCYSETTPLNSSENSNYISKLSDTLALRESVHRLKVGLSSACLLVEAAVGPLESTFKFPKTKKDMMNEWLNKSPERNSLYDNQSIDYVSPRNANLSPYGEKDMNKSMDNVMKATNTMISRLSEGTISMGSTPEKNYMSEQSEPENLAFNIVDSSGTTPDHSPLPYSRVDMKKPELDYQEMNISCDKKVPKRFRKGYKSILDENSSPIKRSLRSNTGIENMYNLDDASYGNVTPPHDESHVVIPVVDEIRDSEILTAPQPPQHSAKKRWLRQAISEESDSPTAESPPNEMVTPLKKRRLARESLSLEPPYGNCDDTQYSVTPKKDSEIPSQNVANQDIIDAKIKNVIFSDESAVTPPVNICTDPKLEKIDESLNNEKPLCPTENEDSNCEEIICERKEINISPEKCEAVVNNETSESVLSDLKFNLSHFSKLKGKMDSKDDACLENRSSVKESHDLVTRDIKSEPVSNINSAETSGNSSPVLDDIDDIKKRIHSFHTENIQILQIRNKKQPKEKRKKVNLTFDLCVLADQTVGVKLKSENEINDTVNIENNPCPKDTTSNETPLRGHDHIKPILETTNDLSAKPQNPIYNSTIFPTENPPVPVESHSGFKFSGSFKGEPNPSISQMPDINIIKNAIDMTTSLDIGLKSSNASSSVDEYKNVQEILSHVNQMDSRNSVLLSGVLRDTNRSIVPETNTTPHLTLKTFVGRPNDPRLNPPPVEAPKPIRRKLSITEYRRRHSMVSNASDTESVTETAQNTSQNDTACNTNLSCMNSDDINTIVGKSIEDSIATDDAHTIQTMIGEMPKTVEDVNSIIGCLPDTSEVETVASEAEPLHIVSNETVEASNATTR